MGLGTAGARGDATGASWGRIALLAILGWWTIRLIASADPWCFVDYANLAFHEAGHLFFRPLGHTLHVLGGTLAQCLVPVSLGTWFLLRERRRFAATFCGWWLGENLVNVARYMADARDLALPLVGGGDHDWNELFFQFGLLGESSVAAVSGTTRGFGILLMGISLLGGTVLVLLRSKPTDDAVPLADVSRRPASRKLNS